MKLRLGQPVNATDGVFGELAEIVVDPHTKAVTHIVVQPRQKQHQARLAPMWLVTEDDGRLTVNLDIAHIRRLERVAASDYINLDETINLDRKWDVGSEDLVTAPYRNYDLDTDWSDDRVGLTYEPIPKRECEVRRSSKVRTADGKSVGHVDGFVVSDDENITALVVRTGIAGFRQDVLVPFGALNSVRNDAIELTLDRKQFDLLPFNDMGTEQTEEPTSLLGTAQNRAEALAGKLAKAGRSLVADTKTRISHKPKT